ncbi:hypothetical protein [Brevibacillus brevis]|uniref:Uncharacterized protein n=1 Tax=Brevibacillus brevis TaxID=1393 RepID=A0A517I934_BREBE|nr:hypothetical protein [Brevibacillus brevis]QDS35376.1 hypothetical protein FPS98_15915 [Brevibacillus brevis]
MRDEWDKTDVCPNPGFYDVVESTVKEAFGFTSPRVKHWVLIMGKNQKALPVLANKRAMPLFFVLF